jgi:hypothetical protein
MNTNTTTAPTRTADGLWFGKDLSQSEPIPEAAIEQAVALMRSGRLHRYGEQGAGTPEPSLLEQEYAAYVGAKYCVAVSSCGAAMFLALKALGVQPGDQVLTSSFTLAPVPGAIAHAGASAVLVETRDDYTTDLADLERKAASSGARVFLLSHMRGHITDLRAVRDICDRHGIALVEDCAHTMGARWDGQHTGTFGRIGCYSAQTYKHINAGEGVAAGHRRRRPGGAGHPDVGLLHDVRPAPAAAPGRGVRALALCHAQLQHAHVQPGRRLAAPAIALLPERGTRWRRIYDDLAQAFAARCHSSLCRCAMRARISCPARSSFRWTCRRRRSSISWPGAPRAASTSSGSACACPPRSPAITATGTTWRNTAPMPQSQAVLRQLLDLRTPLSLTP